jgi:uncharacterized membrane protein YuzA (DUF378 family)
MEENLNAANVTYGVSALGATTWGTQEVLDFNLVTELLGSSPGIAYMVIGAAGVVSLTEMFDVTDFFDK